MTKIRRAIVLLILLAATATCGTGGPSSAVSAPIVGYWNWNDGVIQIKASGSGSFEGAFARAETYPCPQKVGHVILKLTGGGSSYTGQDEWYHDPPADCTARFSSDAKVTLSNSNNTAVDCSDGPFTDVPAVHDCKTLTRATNFKPG